MVGLSEIARARSGGSLCYAYHYVVKGGRGGEGEGVSA